MHTSPMRLRPRMSQNWPHWLHCLVAALAIGALVWGASAVWAALAAPELLSPRPVTECANAQGAPVACITGAITGVDTTLDGRRAVFASVGTQFVPGDTNIYSDIFLWDDGALHRVSTSAAGLPADQASDLPALSGNGRYLVFRSQAGNLIPNTQRDRANLYFKDLTTGQVALVSRKSDGTPANAIGLQAFSQVDVDFSGRYLLFAGDVTGLVAGVPDNNLSQDIFFVDMDADGDGDLFNGAPAIELLSRNVNDTAAAAGMSWQPSLRLDGGAAVWLTRAIDAAPQTGSNGSVADVILAEAGRRADGSLDPTVWTRRAVNRMGDAAAPLTANGARLARIDPWRSHVAFVTADDIPGSGDDHVGEDVYLVTGTLTPTWISGGRGTVGVDSLSLGWDPMLPVAAAAQVAWIAAAPPRALTDIMLWRTAPAFPAGLPAVNWRDVNQPSSAAAESVTLSADGRSALWTTSATYGVPVVAGTVNLYRRTIAPAQQVTLTVAAVGGSVQTQPPGVAVDGGWLFPAMTWVEMWPVAAPGFRWAGWGGVDGRNGLTATVALYAPRTVTATFRAMTPPIAADVAITTAEDTPYTGLTVTIYDPDPDEAHMVTLLTLPGHGVVTVTQGVIDYHPAADFHGVDSFALQVTDAYSLALAAPLWVTVTVTPVNDPPQATAAAGSGVNLGTGIAVTVTVADVDVGDSHTLSLAAPPGHGTVTVDGLGFVYTPTLGFAGTDTFAYWVMDAAGEALAGQAVVTVLSAPTATPTYTATPTPTSMATATFTPEPTPTPTATSTPTPTDLPTGTPTPTGTPVTPPVPTPPVTTPGAGPTPTAIHRVELPLIVK
jgi:hypothetical protein